MLIKEFKSNYLTHQNAMRIGRLIGSYYMYDSNALERVKLKLIALIEGETNRGISDCMEYVDNLPIENIQHFCTLCQKFSR